MKKLFIIFLSLLAVYMLQAQNPSSVELTVNVFLQGPYSGSQNMNTTVNAKGLLSLQQPYGSSPWNYSGVERLDSIPANMVDWILLELRDQYNTLAGRRAALLMNDGTVLDTNMSDSVSFQGLMPGKYFIVVDHRNHLPVMSAYQVNLPNAVSWDFSDTLNYPPFGGGDALYELETNVFGLIVGDINKDGTIKYSGAGNDRSLIIQRIIAATGSTSITSTVSGYFNEDLSMDGVVKYAGAGNDPSKIIQTLIGKTGSTAITTTYSQSMMCSPMPDSAVAGPDSLGIVGNSITLYGNTGTVSSGQWAVVSGSGSVLSDAGSATSMFHGLPDSTYILVWTLSTPCGSTSDTVVIGFQPPPPHNCGDTLIDPRDGQKYGTVLIGDRCWFSENLAYLPEVSPSDQGSLTEPYYYVYDYNDTLVADAKLTDSYNLYGVLYNWEAGQNACPPGWHVPSNNEWVTLSDFLGGASIAGGKMKSIRTVPDPPPSWVAPNLGATNSSGWNGLPGGRCLPSSSPNYTYQGRYSYYLTSTEISGSTMHSKHIYTHSQGLYHQTGDSKTFAYSVRCIRDSVPPCSPQPEQANAGPDSLGVAGDSLQLQGNADTVSSGQWAVSSGIGGVFSDSSSATSVFYGMPGSNYTLVWTLSTPCGSTSDSVVIGFLPPPHNCGDTLIDPRDGQAYGTVLIGDQCWMAENLNIGTMVNSVYINTPHSDVSNNGLIEKYCSDNSPSNCATHGGLYDWDEAMGYTTTEGVQGICMTGWHLPTDAELCTLTAYLDPTTNCNTWGWSGLDAGGKMKETGTTHWNSPNTGATNSSGFTGLPGGYRSTSGNFGEFRGDAYFWSSSTLGSGSLRIFRRLSDNKADIFRYYYTENNGFSVRCLRDSVPCTSQPDQANAGADSLNVAGDSIVLYANASQVASGRWLVANGNGGMLSDSSSATSVFLGMPDSTYTLVWTLSTLCGSTSDTVIIGFAGTPAPDFICGDSLLDGRDGKIYPSVQIGTQCWMAENLNVGEYIESINTQSSHTEATDNGIIEKFCYDNDTLNCGIYGGLYSWAEAMDYDTTEGSQGICPDGWHVPTDADWMALEGTLDADHGPGDPLWSTVGWRGSSLGPALKETGLVSWYEPNISAGNGAGFNGQGPGRRTEDGSFYAIGWYGYHWTSSFHQNQDSWMRILSGWHLGLFRGTMNNERGGTIRCVMDSLTGPCLEPATVAYAGKDSIFFDTDTIQLYAAMPLNGVGAWTDISNGVLHYSGDRSTIPEVNNPESIFIGDVDSTYTLLWTVSNNCGSSHDTITIHLKEKFFQCNDPIIDERDGQVYNTVAIGDQCWMAENLNIGSMIIYSNTGWPVNDSIIEKYCYDNDSTNCDTYGGLYAWDEAMAYSSIEGSQGICPPGGGWHLPSDAEFKILEAFLDTVYGPGDPEWDTIGYRGVNAGGDMKATGFNYWNSPNTGATNVSGFSALAGGYHLTAGPGYFYRQKQFAFFLTSTEYNASDSYVRQLSNGTAAIARSNRLKSRAYSVRCVRDSIPPCTPQPEQANAGPDSLGVAGDSLQLQGNMPTVGSGTWTVRLRQGFGGHGMFSDSSSATSVFYGMPDSTYILVWTLSTACGSTSDTVVIGFAAQEVPFNCGDSLLDGRDGKIYPTVQIGTQCWMAQNLNLGVPLDSQFGQSNNGVVEKYCYNNDTVNCNNNGGLYQWEEVMNYNLVEGSQGICPSGWHVPTDAEWSLLEGIVDSSYGIGSGVWDTYGFRGYDAGGKLKSTSLSSWLTPNTGASNSSGFNALGGGFRQYDAGDFYLSEEFCAFWTSTTEYPGDANTRQLRYDYQQIRKLQNWRTYGFSLRCIYDSIYDTCSIQPSSANAWADSLIADTIILHATSPASGTGQWSVVSGNGGVFADPLSPNTTFTGNYMQTYTIRWTVFTSCTYNFTELTVTTTKHQKFDFLMALNVDSISGAAGLAGCEWTGTEFVVASWGSLGNTEIYRISSAGQLLGSFTPSWITGTTGIRDMAWDGTYLYGSDASSTVYCFTPTGTLITTYSFPVVVRSISYDPTSDAFWVNNWNSNLMLVSRNGLVNDTIPGVPSIYGSAYDRVSGNTDRIWLHSTYSQVDTYIEEYDITTKALLDYHHVSADLNTTGATAGGLFSATDLFNGAFVVGGLEQNTGLLFVYYISDSPGNKSNAGLNLQNGMIIHKKPIQPTNSIHTESPATGFSSSPAWQNKTGAGTSVSRHSGVSSNSGK